MTENTELYDHLSAARIVYQDSFENELDIIRESSFNLSLSFSFSNLILLTNSLILIIL